MHSSETLPAPPATGTNLLLQLGRLIVRSRSTSPTRRAPQTAHDKLLQAKLLAAKPSTSKQVQTQPEPIEEKPRSAVEAQLKDHIQVLWNEHIPICIEVLLAPDCSECYASLKKIEVDSSCYKLHTQQRALLLERWTIRAIVNKPHDSPTFITSQWLLNAVRSQLHFSQFSAWLARLKDTTNSGTDETPGERRRKLSREKCNFKKLESNCDKEDLQIDDRTLNVIYSIKIPGESYKSSDFIRPPIDHTFPTTDIGNNTYLKVLLQSLPRIDKVPTVKCFCQPKRRTSKEFPINTHDELIGKLNDLTLGPKSPMFGNVSSDYTVNANVGTSNRKLSVISSPDGTEFMFRDDPETEHKDSLLDDRMLTPCSENGKHKCNCDDESDGKENNKSSTSISQETKKIDECRLKEIVKYKRRLRKEKLKKLNDITSSEGDGLLKSKETTSIPILQAARFDRFRAIGCFRNQTYLTLPASRVECKSPFSDVVHDTVIDVKKTNSVSTQTDDFACHCGEPLQVKCDTCRKMVRSEASYDLASLDREENSARRKHEEDDKVVKKHKCDNFSISNNIKSDINSFNDSISYKVSERECISNAIDNGNDTSYIVKRPKLRRLFPTMNRIEKIVSERCSQRDSDRDIEVLHLKNDDSVFLTPRMEKRQKTFSIGENDFVVYEKYDCGTMDKYDMESPSKESSGFKFTDLSSKGDVDNQVPSPTEMDRFRWRFDSAASMVFHTKTGLPLTSSPAPLRRGNNCFDFDDSINGIPGIKSALFHPVSPPSPALPPSPSPAHFAPTTPRARTPPCATNPRRSITPRALLGPPPRKSNKSSKLKIGPSTGLLGNFEESALKGRLEPVATVHGFTAELGASGAFCPPHKRLPVTVFFYAPGGTNAPYMGHINLGPSGYKVPRSGTVQVSLFNPHGTLVKMFVVLYDLTCMPPLARTFLRQRTLYMPAGAEPPAPGVVHKWLRYLIHLRFMTSKSGKLYLHTDIRILVSRKSDLDTATALAHSLLPTSNNKNKTKSGETLEAISGRQENSENGDSTTTNKSGERAPNRVFGGCGEFESDFREIGHENRTNDNVSYELRSFTYAPENPKFSTL